MVQFNILNYGNDAIRNQAPECYDFQVTITRGHGPNKKWLHTWTVPFHVYTKWKWYFEYRFCIEKLANPKAYIVLNLYWSERVDIKLVQAKLLQNAILGKQRKISQIRNSMHKAKLQWTSFLPIENDPLWTNAMLKLKEKESELATLISNK